MAAGIVAAFSFSPIKVSAEQGFFSVIEDLPLMPSLLENREVAITFESSAGRVVDVQADGVASPSAVDAYYKESLPQLGWKAQNNGSYLRENELLFIKIETGQNNMVKVLFNLRPLSP